MPDKPSEKVTNIRVSLVRQELVAELASGIKKIYPISTAKLGPGEFMDSGCTPRGRHRVRAKIGDGCPENTVFVGRRPTGEIFTAEMAVAQPSRDWILTRILWLTGMEIGRNRGGSRDTLRRYIYIHGTADEASLGKPVSHGCIRMSNNDVLDLFERIDVGTSVEIIV